ncbi:porin family protein [Tenacibaculum sp. IB213877]|uniref:porin family protein n=1 Tax=Tenacibaculum sp. IB213877 TaxID=3097351 RepID=UPI002A5A41E3|nr:porin family protein [Tenacibaculum sp. IB213877]MDY0780166.1 porin family protein [Tenacibaculum sp. IB213877]
MERIKILLILTGLIFTNFIIAQEKVKLGVNAGVNYSSLRESDNIFRKTDSDFAYLVGAKFEYIINENISIITDINYEVKKTSYDVTVASNQDDPWFPNTNLKVKTNQNFLTVPMLINFKFGSSNTFFLNGGPFLSYLLNAKSHTQGNVYADESSKFKKTDFGISFGIGKIISLDDKNDLIIELRDNYGLIDINSNLYNDFNEVKTNSLNLTVSWSFNL